MPNPQPSVIAVMSLALAALGCTGGVYLHFTTRAQLEGKREAQATSIVAEIDRVERILSARDEKLETEIQAVKSKVDDKLEKIDEEQNTQGRTLVRIEEKLTALIDRFNDRSAQPSNKAGRASLRVAADGS